jgi:hypothetical protein
MKSPSPYTFVDRHSPVPGGPQFRAGRPGAEAGLVDQFLADIPVGVPEGCRLTVFREPRLESGFPDLVVVVWDPKVTARWLACRRDLQPADIRLMHFLATREWMEQDYLERMIGYPVGGSLNRLSNAEMVRCSEGAVRASSLTESFAVRDIVAVEAKMTASEAVLSQAWLNTWFASKSYVLVPILGVRSNFLTRARKKNVGVWVGDDVSTVRQLASTHEQIPRSYASWLFNEWVWRVEASGP